jgi:hypothetical protein
MSHKHLSDGSTSTVSLMWPMTCAIWNEEKEHREPNSQSMMGRERQANFQDSKDTYTSRI